MSAEAYSSSPGNYNVNFGPKDSGEKSSDSGASSNVYDDLKNMRAESEAASSSRLRGDEGSMDVGKIVDATKTVGKELGRGVKNAAESIFRGGNKVFDWATQRDKEFATDPKLTDLEKARNTLAVAREKQKSVFARWLGFGKQDILDAEAQYNQELQNQVKQNMKELVNRNNLEVLEKPETQVQLLMMVANERCERAKSETAAKAARKGGRAGAFLARHPGLRVGLGIGLMVGGVGATMLGFAPAPAMIGLGGYMAARGNIDRGQETVREGRKEKNLQKDLNKILSENNASGKAVLDTFVYRVNNVPGETLSPEAQAFINNATTGQELPQEVQLMLLNMQKAENELARTRGSGIKPSQVGGIENWIYNNKPREVANIVGKALNYELESESKEAAKQGRGNRYKIATSVGLGLIGSAAVAGVSLAGEVPNAVSASAVAGGFGLAEFIIQKRRKDKKDKEKK
ncbi:hypothetical protein HYX70_01165 [Candidatus Saccharibacteria bacterium]|nr:hypothetical protein [Candidatus Saccharibacteria bacterium]